MQYSQLFSSSPRSEPTINYAPLDGLVILLDYLHHLLSLLRPPTCAPMRKDLYQHVLRIPVLGVGSPQELTIVAPVESANSSGIIMQVNKLDVYCYPLILPCI